MQIEKLWVYEGNNLYQKEELIINILCYKMKGDVNINVKVFINI